LFLEKARNVGIRYVVMIWADEVKGDWHRDFSYGNGGGYFSYVQESQYYAEATVFDVIHKQTAGRVGGHCAATNRAGVACFGGYGAGACLPFGWYSNPKPTACEDLAESTSEFIFNGR
jgi:hypothetical protein